MKALIISSLLFFSLRAMSSEVGENQKSECPYARQTSKREALVVAVEATDSNDEVAVKVISK